MVFQRMGKKDNAGRFERGYQKVTTENLTSWTLPGREKPPKTNFSRCPQTNLHQTSFFSTAYYEE